MPPYEEARTCNMISCPNALPRCEPNASKEEHCKPTCCYTAPNWLAIWCAMLIWAITHGETSSSGRSFSAFAKIVAIFETGNSTSNNIELEELSIFWHLASVEWLSINEKNDFHLLLMPLSAIFCRFLHCLRADWMRQTPHVFLWCE